MDFRIWVKSGATTIPESTYPAVFGSLPQGNQFSTQPVSITFTILVNDKLLTAVDILTFISMVDTTPDSLKAREVFILQHFIIFLLFFYEQLKFQAQLS